MSFKGAPLQRPKSEEWVTPQKTFDELDAEFNFDLDVCADKQNAKCARYFNRKDDGLEKSWATHRCWMNPPYGRVGLWIEKAYKESLKGALVVSLVFARTDTHWWHKWAMMGEIRFLKGRLYFLNPYSLYADRAPAPSAVIIFRPSVNRLECAG